MKKIEAGRNGATTAKVPLIVIDKNPFLWIGGWLYVAGCLLRC